MENITTFYELLKNRAETYPEKTAVLYDTHAVSYQKLFDDVVKKAMHLSKFNGKQVALYGPSSYRWIVNLFGIILSGKNAVLVDFFLPPDMKVKVLNKVGVDYILSSTNQYILADSTASIIPSAEKDDVDGADYEPTVTEGNILLFTATKNECDKAVVLAPSHMLQAVREVGKHCNCNQDDLVLSQISLHHIFGLVYSLLWPLYNGACVCIGRGIRHIDADTYYYHVTIITVTPAMADYLKRVKAFNKDLRSIIIGGAPCPFGLLEYLKDCDYDVHAVYGMTECTGCIGINNGLDGSYEVFADTEVTIGEDHEIIVKGPCVMGGYYNDQKTNDRVLRDGAFHTGDYGYLNENGNLVITSRNHGILLLSTGEKICRTMIMQELNHLNGIADSYVTVFQNRLSALLVPVIKSRNADSFKKLIDSYNERKGYRWEVQRLAVTADAIPKNEDGSVDEEAVNNMLENGIQI